MTTVSSYFCLLTEENGEMTQRNGSRAPCSSPAVLTSNDGRKIFTAPPTDPEEMRLWFRSKVHREHKKQESREKVLKHISRSVLQDTQDSAAETDVSQIKLKLTETPTIWFLTITSGCSLNNPEEEDKIKAENERYTKTLCVDPEVGKKLNAEVQTANISEKTKGCETLDVKVANSFVNASAWDLYDTYAEVAAEKGFGIKEFQMLIDTALKTRGVIQTELSIGSEHTRMPADVQMKRLIKTDRFQYCVLILERLLASPTFQKKQSLLRSSNRGRYDEVEPSTFSYEIRSLWILNMHLGHQLAVTALEWNPYNPGLLAVGYGQMNFEEASQGFVCLWSRKNPSHPERKINLEQSVTTLSFSKSRPNLLAVGCRSGDVLLINVAGDDGVRCFPSGSLTTQFGPIWKVQWFLHHKVVEIEEELMVLGEAGILRLFSFSDDKSSKELIQLNYTTKLNLTTNSKTIYSSKTLSGLCFSLVPEEFICYISSKEGIIVKCVFRPPCFTESRMNAHKGPAYVIQHSPASSMVLLTCGADHMLKIWVDGIDEPLITLTSSMRKTMVCAEWSPSVPTMIATLSTTELAIWDISRKTDAPMNLIKIRTTDPGYSTLKFSADGKVLVIGDQQGLVKVHQLTDLPREPFLKVESLISALISATQDNSRILYKLQKIIRSRKNKFKTYIP